MLGHGADFRCDLLADGAWRARRQQTEVGDFKCSPRCLPLSLAAAALARRLLGGSGGGGGRRNYWSRSGGFVVLAMMMAALLLLGRRRGRVLPRETVRWSAGRYYF